jgi:hypothetical protein
LDVIIRLGACYAYTRAGNGCFAGVAVYWELNAMGLTFFFEAVAMDFLGYLSYSALVVDAIAAFFVFLFLFFAPLLFSSSVSSLRSSHSCFLSVSSCPL